ncbi:MAG TPA: hypothetical protein VFQ91_14270 [Bryobacteraceae bacterium]|nr:hypothetical protein [Bryobacteraceae bacterium]
MKILDCARCWYGVRKRVLFGAAADCHFECGHPDRLDSRRRPSRMQGPTGLIQLAACPRNV